MYESSMSGDDDGDDEGTGGWIGTLTQEERDSIVSMVTQAVNYHGSLNDQARMDVRAKFKFDPQHLDEAVRWVYTQRNLMDTLARGQADVYNDEHCVQLRGVDCERYCKYFVQKRADEMYGNHFSRFVTSRLASSLMNGRSFRPREWRALLCHDANLRAKLEEAHRLCVLDGTVPARLHAPLPYQGDLQAAVAQADWEAARDIQKATGVTGHQETSQLGAKPEGKPAGAPAPGEAPFQVGERVEYLARVGTSEKWVPAEVTNIDRSALPHGISVRLDDHAGTEERSTDLDRVRYPMAKATPASVPPSPAGAWSGGPPGSVSPAGGQLMRGAAWIYRLDAAGRQLAVSTINQTLTERLGLPPAAQASIASQLEYSRQELDEMLVWAVDQGAVTLSVLDAKGLLARRALTAYEEGKAAAGKAGAALPCPQRLLDAEDHWRRGCARGNIGSEAQGFAIFGPSPALIQARGEEDARHTVLARHAAMEDGTVAVCLVVSAKSDGAAKDWFNALVKEGYFRLVAPHADTGRWGGISFRRDQSQGGNVYKSNEIIVRCKLGSKDDFIRKGFEAGALVLEKGFLHQLAAPQVKVHRGPGAVLQGVWAYHCISAGTIHRDGKGLLNPRRLYYDGPVEELRSILRMLPEGTWGWTCAHKVRGKGDVGVVRHR